MSAAVAVLLVAGGLKSLQTATRGCGTSPGPGAETARAGPGAPGRDLGRVAA
ncbi:hypothetical protein ACFVFI_19525 [Streptomyces sp. NPDC057705]|uniref:hypothetical protein n=1 Tax=Streptomyces sp. NPDC057705 TaxID=3346222 RepID=UPI00369FDA15